MKNSNILSFILYISFIFTKGISLAQSPLYQSPCSQIVWQDEFDGPTLDLAKWSYQTGDGCPDLCGWGNGELQWYTDQVNNVKIESGKLVITAIEETMSGKNYTSGRIRTENKGDFTFGRIEARIKMPLGKGLWPAFWMLPTDWTYGGWPNSGEVDIVEYIGGSPTSAWGTLHYYANGNKYNGKTVALSGGQKFSDDFHVFAIEWDSTQIKWYMDNVNYHTMTTTDVAPGQWVFNERFNLILNVAVGGLGGTPDLTTVFPQTMEVDYVRVYSNPLNTSIKGKTRVFNGDNTIYSLSGDPTITNYQWQVPAGATINSGQGTDTISVTWGSTSGNITVTASKPCGDLTLTLPVTTFTDNCKITFEDHNANKNITYVSSTGTYTADFTNPIPDAVNNTSRVGKYTRSSQTKDMLIFKNVPLENATKFESGEKNFYMDVLSFAPIGTTIEIQLQNAAKATGAFPIGRRSTFAAITSTRSNWERLAFKLSSIDDAGTLPEEVDQLVMLFAPDDVVSSKTYYFDNFNRGSVQQKDVSGNATVACSAIGEIYSVPVESGSTYSWTAPVGTTISGQGTNQITVNWGSTSGYIKLT